MVVPITDTGERLPRELRHNVILLEIAMICTRRGAPVCSVACAHVRAGPAGRTHFERTRVKMLEASQVLRRAMALAKQPSSSFC